MSTPRKRKPPTAAEREAAFERRKREGTWLLVNFKVVSSDGTTITFRTMRGFDGIEYKGRDAKDLERILFERGGNRSKKK